MNERYKVEPWPPQPKGGMQVGAIPTGCKVTDLKTGYHHACNIYRSQHQNRDACIYHLKAIEALEGES